MSRDFSKYDFTKFDPTQKYNLYIDSDTIAYSCAAACSKEPCLVTHKASGRKKTFDNFDAFDDFLLNDEKGKNFKLDDFIVPVIGFALSNVKSKVEVISDIGSKNWVNLKKDTRVKPSKAIIMVVLWF